MTDEVLPIGASSTTTSARPIGAGCSSAELQPAGAAELELLEDLVAGVLVELEELVSQGTEERTPAE